jgi:hypothetical protein
LLDDDVPVEAQAAISGPVLWRPVAFRQGLPP